MKKSMNSFRNSIIFIMMLAILVCGPAELFYSASLIAHAAPLADEEASVDDSISDESVPSEIVEITNIDDFLEFVDNCKLDTYSLGKKFVLTRDIALGYSPFEGVPYFNGTFDGNGYEISFNTMNITGSDYGFFRYIGHEGNVCNLSVSGNIKAVGSASNIGGIAGVNYGTVSDCSYTGTLQADDCVGGIIGENAEDALVFNCTSNGVIEATNYTGGIVGHNFGFITGCTNESAINTSELEVTVDIDSEVDLSSLNLAKNIINRNNMGGIVGGSSGIVSLCVNNGTVGYNHTGYNVGGIAGIQSGQIYECINNGNVFGRKDVGGIVGQAEPYVESDYLNDKLNDTKDDLNELSNSLSGISSATSGAVNNTGVYVDKLVDQYTSDMDRIKDSIDEISQVVSDNKPGAQQYVDNIMDAFSEIQEVSISQGIYSVPNMSSVSINATNAADYARELQEYEEYIESLNRNGNVSLNSVSVNQASIATIQKDLQIINSNMRILEQQYSASMNSAEDALNNFLNEVKDTGEYQTIEDLVNSVDRGIDSVMSAARNTEQQLGSMVDQISSDIEYITNGDGIITDISSVDTESQNGVIAKCVNYAEINGDINVGGVAGTMNIEYDLDPEYDIDISEQLNVVLRTRVNDVVIHCMSNGAVTSKKNCAAGVVALQEFGIVYDCEGYGKITAEAGDYVGGVVGQSLGTVQDSYSFANLSGGDYVGGIAGFGTSIVNCISITELRDEGECYGGVAGNISGDGTVSGNYCVSESVQAIDGISYEGVAKILTYDEIMALPNVPQGFNRVFVKFMIDGELVKEIELPYGASLEDSDYPELVEKEGYYVSWEHDADANRLETNVVINAIYTPWTESIAGPELNDHGNALFMIAGEFYDGTTVSMDVIRGPESLDESQTLHYAFSWNLENARSISFNQVEAHFYAGDDVDNAKLYINVDNKWSEVETYKDGSYIVAYIPLGASFAVINEKTDYTFYYICGGVGIILAILIISVMRHRHLKKVLKQREQAIRERDLAHMSEEQDESGL